MSMQRRGFLSTVRCAIGMAAIGIRGTSFEKVRRVKKLVEISSEPQSHF